MNIDEYVLGLFQASIVRPIVSNPLDIPQRRFSSDFEMMTEPTFTTHNKFIPSEDVRPLSSQVAGHAHEVDKPGMLKHKDGFVLKPLLKPELAKREIEFYEGLHSAPHAALASFVPKFYGSANISLECYKGEVMILEDVTGALQKPCIMDVKIGKQTWDPFATASKIQSENKKYAECKKQLGFCIPGFQVYDSDTEELKKFDKNYGKSLNKDIMPNVFSTFLNMSKSTSAVKVIDVYLSQLKKIQDILSCQTSIHLYSSSILLTYDCAQLDKSNDASSWSHVYMIDFAHTYTCENLPRGLDKNYLDGLEGLIQVLSCLKG